MVVASEGLVPSNAVDDDELERPEAGLAARMSTSAWAPVFTAVAGGPQHLNHPPQAALVSCHEAMQIRAGDLCLWSDAPLLQDNITVDSLVVMMLEMRIPEVAYGA